jgi:hypothetical protein
MPERVSGVAAGDEMRGLQRLTRQALPHDRREVYAAACRQYVRFRPTPGRSRSTVACPPRRLAAHSSSAQRSRCSNLWQVMRAVLQTRVAGACATSSATATRRRRRRAWGRNQSEGGGGCERSDMSSVTFRRSVVPRRRNRAGRGTRTGSPVSRHRRRDLSGDGASSRHRAIDSVGRARRALVGALERAMRHLVSIGQRVQRVVLKTTIAMPASVTMLPTSVTRVSRSSLRSRK